MIYQGDCIDIMPTLDAESVDSIVTDPPYGLSFMGKDWDHGVPGVPFWEAALRVAKPGAFMLAFGGTRTFHRLAVAIEDAGWEIRDTVMWVYGSGFPKSLDVSKAIDKAAGAKRGKIGESDRGSGAQLHKLNAHGPGDTGIGYMDGSGKVFDITAPATDAARQWEGWGTSLKPAWEPIIVARKPIVGTVAANVLKYGTGAINIDGCRVDTFQPGELDRLKARADTPRQDFTGGRLHSGAEYTPKIIESGMSNKGRWPANIIHDGSEEVLELFPNSKTARCEKPSDCKTDGETSFDCMRGNRPARGYDGEGSAARFFYCAKASKQDRDEGCDELPLSDCGMMEDDNYPIKTGSGNLRETKRRNNHPTVKPTSLMRYLCRLVTPPGGVVLDPFMGSGSTGKAASLEGLKFIGIELEKEYTEIAERRIGVVQPLFAGA